MVRLIDTLGGLWELALLAARTGFRFRGRYWRWRADTAFGTDPATRPPSRERLAMILEYGRWLWRMRKA